MSFYSKKRQCSLNLHSTQKSKRKGGVSRASPPRDWSRINLVQYEKLFFPFYSFPFSLSAKDETWVVLFLERDSMILGMAQSTIRYKKKLDRAVPTISTRWSTRQDPYFGPWVKMALKQPVDLCVAHCSNINQFMLLSNQQPTFKKGFVKRRCFM